MKAKQIQQIQNMYRALQTISKDYMTPSQLRRNSEKTYGLDYEDSMEMSYENMQELAKQSIKGVKIDALISELNKE